MALVGEVRIVLPAGFSVDAGASVTVLGRTTAAAPPVQAGGLTPVIRLRSVAILGNVLTCPPPGGSGQAGHEMTHRARWPNDPPTANCMGQKEGNHSRAGLLATLARRAVQERPSASP